MLIQRLALLNFKSYEDADIEFLAGTNAIIGSNGAGKSTLLEAIGFALFDYQPAGFKLAGLLREGAASGSVTVALVSSLDERPYEVERAFTGTTTTRYRVYDVDMGRVAVAEGADEVGTWLRQHLKVEPGARLDYLFENTIGVPQGTNTAPFQQTPSVRKSIFDPLLQVDEYRKASDNLRATEHHLEGIAGDLRERIARMEGQLAELPHLEAEGETLAATVAQLAAESETLRAEVARLTAEAAALDAAEAAVREAAARLERARAEQALGATRLGAAERAAQEAEEAEAQVAAAGPGHAAYLAADARLHALEGQRAERDALRARLAAVEREEAGLAAQLESLAQALARIEVAAARMAELAPAVARQREIEGALAEARQAAADLAEAGRRRAAAGHEAESARTQVAQVAAALEQARALEASLATQRARLAELAAETQRLREARAAAEAESARLERQSASLGESAAARCPVCEAELTPEHRADLLARNAAAVAELHAAVAGQKKQLKTLAAESQRVQAEIDAGNAALRRLPAEGELDRAGAELARREAELAGIAARVAALAGAPERAAALEADLAALGDPRRAHQIAEAGVAERAKTAAAHAAAAARRETLAAEGETLRGELAAYAALDEAMRAAGEERARHAADHERHLANQRLAGQLPARREAAETLRTEVAALSARAAALDAEHAAAAAGYDAGRHAELRREAADQRDALTRAATRLSGARERQATVAAAVAQLRGLAGELARRQAELEETGALRDLVRDVRELLRQAGPYVTRQLVYQISQEASAIYADIMDDHTGRLNWSEDYDLSLEIKGRARGFRQFSGGEQMSAALALRLALLRKTSNIDVAFFDEPTAHLDLERRDGLADKIMQVKGFSQVFVISHDDTFERAAHHYIHIVKDGGGSRLDDEGGPDGDRRHQG